MPFLLHYFLHLGFPALLAWLFFRPGWLRAYGILLATMLVDVDHLLADPIFAAGRCSIQFHPLHTYYAIGVYVLLLFCPRPWRIISVGLLWHMATDLLDCLMMYQQCPVCHADAPALPLLETLTTWLVGH